MASSMTTVPSSMSKTESECDLSNNGGVGVRRPFVRDMRCFDLRENIPPVQVRTLRLFILAFRSGEDLGLLVVHSSEGVKADRYDSVVLSSALISADTFASCSSEGEPQKCFLFEGGLPELVDGLGVSDEDNGRLGLDVGEDGTSLEVIEDSVGDVEGCGEMFRERLDDDDGLGGLGMELTLPDAECDARTVEVLPSVSDEIKDSGRGISETVSEKATRGFVKAPGSDSRRPGEAGGVARADFCEPGEPGVKVLLWSKNVGLLTSAGVVGAESVRCFAMALALIIDERSTSATDNAPDLLCLCPLPTGGPLAARFSLLTGLVLKTAVVPSLPTNSLVPLLCATCFCTPSPNPAFVGLGVL